MKRQKIKSDKINKNVRNVKIPCVDCGRLLNFRIEKDIVLEGDGVIACNIPGAVCDDCINSVLDRVADPPGLTCINLLNPILAQELILNFEFLLPSLQAVGFFLSMFPENDLIYEACEQRLHGEKKQ